MVHAPSDYRADRDWPLLLVLHWSTARGSDTIDMWRRTADAFGVIVACPSSRYYGGWSAGDRDRILGEIAEIGADYRVDSSRIYVVGYSSGANFAYRLMVENPGLFKGVAPYAGRLTSSNRALATLPLRDRTRVCVFHGSLDTTIPIQHAVRAVTRLRRAGFDVRARRLQHGHWFPRRTTDDLWRCLSGA